MMLAGIWGVFRDFGISNQQDNLADAKDYIKQNELSPALIEFFETIDRSIDIQGEIYGAWNDIENIDLQSEVEQKPDLSEVIDPGDIPYPREETNNLADKINKITTLEKYKKDLTKHKDNVAFAVIFAGLIGSILLLFTSQYALENSNAIVLLITTIISGFIFVQLYKFWSKRKEIQETAHQLEVNNGSL